MNRYRRLLLFLLLLHVAAMSWYLHRLPGLLGDEGSEGENVFQILDTKQLTVYGERSYIGPLIDYVRIPFVTTFGYTALALRIPIVIFSIITFLLVASVTKRIFGESAALNIVAAVFFSPMYLLYQRLGWAITLIPFFTIFIVWLLQRATPWKYLWVGLAAGIGLHNHFIFLPTLVTLVVTGTIFVLLKRVTRSGFTSAVVVSGGAPPLRGEGRPELDNWSDSEPVVAGPAEILNQILAGGIGFLAGFGTQLAVLLTEREDQGVPGKVLALFYERLVQLPDVLPGVASGSVVHAFYTGSLWSQSAVMGVAAALVFLILGALSLSRHKAAVWLWLLAIIMQLLVLVLIVDRYAVRYLALPVLAFWGLAGLGVWAALSRLIKNSAWLAWVPLLLAVALTGLSIPAAQSFLNTGGSTNPVHLTLVRSEPAAAFVDIRPLLTCVRNRGPVYSESVHIYNRLLYLSRGITEIAVTENQADAALMVDYRTTQSQPSNEEICPDLQHFQVLSTK